jgi:hypothetical protein
VAFTYSAQLSAARQYDRAQALTISAAVPVDNARMDRSTLERVSVRSALALGFCATFGLWLYTGYLFNRRIDTLQIDATAVAARYLRAQELLATVRSQVLLGSVEVRDALLSSEPPAWEEGRAQIDASYRDIIKALDDYEPVLGSTLESDALSRLRVEVERFHRTSVGALDDARGASPSAVRDVLMRNLGPRRDAAIGISEEIQQINRRAFVQEQREIEEIHRVAATNSRRGLGLALVIGMGVVLLTSVYAARLESRLRSQLKRDVRMSLELHDAATQLLAAKRSLEPPDKDS